MNALTRYVLHLADNALILGHRNSEWCGHGPVLEQDIALTNIALDLIGQSRLFYQYAAEIENGNKPAFQSAQVHGPATEMENGSKQAVPVAQIHGPITEMENGSKSALQDLHVQEPVTEDSLAFLRDARTFLNFLMPELPNGDWGQTILRQFLFSAYQYPLYQRLSQSTNQRIAEISAKSIKETTYHLRWSSEWVIRLGDGTEESNRRMLHALDQLWEYTGEFFEEPADSEEASLIKEGIAAQPAETKKAFMEKVESVFQEATLPIPNGAAMQRGGRQGLHTEHLGYLLSEMQFLQRAYPGAEW